MLAPAKERLSRVRVLVRTRACASATRAYAYLCVLVRACACEPACASVYAPGAAAHSASRQVGSVTVAAGLLLVAGLVDVATRATPGPRMNMVKPSQSTMLYDIPNFGTNSAKDSG